jgi:hypothetical protein
MRATLLAGLALLLLPAAAAAQAVDMDPRRIGTDDEMVDGHRIRLSSGKVRQGLIENPDATDPILVLKTDGGRVEVPRADVVTIEKRRIHADLVYSAEERHRRAVEEDPPRSARDHLRLARTCYRIGAYRRAIEHARTGRARLRDRDGNLPAALGEGLRLFLLAARFQTRALEIGGLRATERCEEALEALVRLREEMAKEPALREVVPLDRIERRIRLTAISPRYIGVWRVFWRTLRRLAAEKAREDALSYRDALLWASRPDGLAGEIFAAIGEELELAGEDVRRIWDLRILLGPRRLNYRGATFLRPETYHVLRDRPPVPGRVSPEEWWRNAGPEDRERLLVAWFAEYTGTLQVLRLENRRCHRCGGTGLRPRAPARRQCPACNGAGHACTVICR